MGWSTQKGSGGDQITLAGPRPAPTVLCVEDNLSNLQLIERIFTRRGGVRLLTCTQGRQACDLARQHRPDLILLDLHLGDLDGEQVLAQLQHDPSTGAVPVVVVSADANPEQARRLLAAGAREYVTKPLDIAQFLAVVDAILQPAPPGPELAGSVHPRW